MRISAIKVDATAVDVVVTDERLTVILADGRELSAPPGVVSAAAGVHGCAAAGLAIYRTWTGYSLA